MTKKMIVALLLLCGFALPSYSLGIEMVYPQKRTAYQKGRVKPDHEIKAAFIVRFIDYVDWPPETGINDRSKPFIIGIVGETPITPYLETQASMVTTRKKKVTIKRIEKLNEILHCHALFISKSVEQVLSEIIDTTQDKPILTIGDTEGYARKGVHINLYKARESVRFEINESAIRSSPLVASSVLLKLSRIVEPLRRHD